MEKVFYFFVLCLYVLGTLGSIGYTAYQGAYPITVGAIVVGVMAFDKAKMYFGKLKE